jgi:hypothetical protein
MLLNYWRTQTVKEKFLLIVISGLIIFGSVTYAKYTIANHKLIKTQKDQLKIYSDSLKITKELLNKTINIGKSANTNAFKRSKETNTKLKNDTDKINNSYVTDPELEALLAEYESKVRNK